MIRVAIADDQELVRAGFRMIVGSQPDMEIAGEAGDGRQAIELVQRERPDVVLMDIRMPHVDGIAATRQVAGLARVVILTTYELDEYVFDALAAGASAFLLKSAPPEDLLKAIRVVTSGDALLAPSVTRRLIEEFARRPEPAARKATQFETLTDRERDVLRELARGFTNAEIAARLHVAETTVKTHVAHVLDKLEVRDRVQAVILAYEAGLAGTA
ncbi:MAG: DNA-binding response regulator [Actinobacteria bacterium 13_1_20CM_2_65_11]|nr:MAG: DNA-binding response regulator [Chloroflexi bacterium 13_1_40CM_65_17]OLC64031.1 MAG: DNA-binding response regulator [Actinobacteria bacterium 13_1_40CM_4_65_12]OLD23571.1 MAG: DNA-binding response regulator [Chloroflexi bacterium 13_1_40CM_3_65_12]OLD49714.1 MAG: DNA-binding response regulator [Actinobacteria bacterium 13_1_40CM_2_65_8]OLE81364.1 MAG: DNA-binding response regulator [Actinobacteria bacterium 13_1_20CM_2_65_11]